MTIHTVFWADLELLDQLRVAYLNATKGLNLNWTQAPRSDNWFGVCRWQVSGKTYECNIRLATQAQSAERKGLRLEEIDIVVNPSNPIPTPAELCELIRKKARMLQ